MAGEHAARWRARYSSEVAGTIPAADLVAKSFIEVDVTGAVSNWLSGTSNFGFAIVTATGNVRLASKEGLGTGIPALLEIESSDGSVLLQRRGMLASARPPRTRRCKSTARLRPPASPATAQD